MLTKEEKKRRAELCKNCYTCEVEVDKNITIDDMKEGGIISPQKVELSKEQKAELCRQCFTCEKGVSSDITVDDMEGQPQKEMSEEQKAELCRKCYTCEVNVGGDRPVGDIEKEKVSRIISPEKDRRAELCRQCFSCERGVSPDITIDDMKGKGAEMTMPFVWYLFPTNGCNFACTYCYATNKPGRMTRNTMHKMLEWLFKKQPNKNLTCHFFGGEPTLEWDMLTDTVEIGNQLAAKNGYRVTWSMTTNGALLNTERLDWIEKHFRPGNPFLLSLDGRPKTHDKYRILHNGKPTYHLIPVDEILERFPTIEVRPTIMPETAEDWFEDFCYLRNKGFKAIAIEPDYEVEWSEEQKMGYERMLQKLGKYYVYAQKLGKPIYMKFIDGVRGQVGNGGQPPGGRMCGVAYNCGAIDHRGKLYACQRYASYNEPAKYALGDVENGWDEYKLYEAQILPREAVHGDITKGYNCSTCEIRQFCMKGCNSANKKIMGSRELALPLYCELSKIEVKVALSVLAELGLLSLKGERRSSEVCKI